MKDTRNFRTKTTFMPRANKKVEGIWEIAIDLGYSAVKLFSPNMVARFPTYAKRVDDTFSYAGETPKASILYKNLETGETWLVGEVAQNIMKNGDPSDSETVIYARDRTSNPMFKVTTEAGLGIGMLSNEFGQPGNDKIVIQTGLPEDYIEDAAYLKDFLARGYNFALKIADGPWQEFHFSISREDIDVMSQPKGSLFSICIDSNGNFVPEAVNYLNSSIIVFDAGFGTLDLFPIVAGTVDRRLGQTFTNLGMKRVLQETQIGIKNQLNVDVSVPAMQKNLETGKVLYQNKKEYRTAEYEFGDILAEASKKVCEEAISLTAETLDFTEYQYLVITGGTGAAWYNQICKKLEGMETLTKIPGNQNDKDLPFVYANVRGYYFYRYNKLAQNA